MSSQDQGTVIERMWPPGKGPELLPDELLAYIFVIGTFAPPEPLRDPYPIDQSIDEDDDEDEDDGWDTDAEAEGEAGKELEARAKAEDKDMEVVEENEEDDEHDKSWDRVNKKLASLPPDLPPFQERVSQVCQTWRNIALSTPQLWSDIDLIPPFIKSRAYLERSQGYPINIILDTDLPFDDSRTQYSDPDQMEYVDFMTGMLLVMPHAQRFRTLSITVEDWELMHGALRQLSSCKGAPLLEELQLYHHEEEPDAMETFIPSLLKDPLFVPFSGNCPNLKVVALWGTHLDWEGSLPLLKGLVDFEFAWHTYDVRPSYKQFSQIMKASPDMQNLSLCASGPAGEDVGTWLESYTPEEIQAAALENDGASVLDISLPKLERLTLSNIPSDYVSAMMQFWKFPVLDQLLLDLDMDDYSVFTRLLVTSGLIKTVSELKLKSLPCDTGSIVMFLHGLGRCLRRLMINLDFVELTWLHLLANIPGTEQPSICPDEQDIPLQSVPKEVWLAAAANPANDLGNTSSSPVEQKPFLPKLEGLSITGVSGDQLRWFIERRKEMGVPIKQLFINRDAEFTNEEVGWLQGHVEEFGYYEESEDELDEDWEDSVDSHQLAMDLDYFASDYPEDEDIETDEWTDED